MRKLLSMGIFLIIIVFLTGCGKADNYYKNGKKSFENGSYEKAALSFEKAIKKNPNKAEYLIDYGMTLIALGKYEDSIKQFDLAYMDKNLKIVRENNKRVYRGKGIAYYHIQQYQKAVTEFEKAVDISELPKLNEDILYYMGSSLIAIGSYDKAIDVYTTILTEDDKNASAYSNRAFCYRNKNEFEKSLTDYNKAIKVDSKDYYSYYGKYFLLLDMGDDAGALEVLNEAAKIKDETTEGEYNKAKVSYFLGDYETALAELNKGFTNGFTEAYYYIGEIYRHNKDYPNAIYYYENYIKSGSINSPNVYNQIASCLMKNGNSEDAIEYLELGLSYNQADTLQILKKNEIIAYENLGKYDLAKEKLTDYLKNYPDDDKALREVTFVDTRLNDMSAE